jgi:glycosyltransferase involved in cell wall biosynthesis
MQIAQVAPLAESVPPKLYGGTERIVSWLTEELVRLGHDVTLFASGDSVTEAKLKVVCPRALRLGRPRTDPTAAYAILLEALAESANDFDVIHCHTDWLHLPLLKRMKVPFITTLHGRLDVPGLSEVIRGFPEAPFISISDSQRIPLPEANWMGTVHHGIPPGSLQPRFEAGSYLAFLGRISPEKGPEVAIRIARSAQMPLQIAAKIPRADTRYFKEVLQQMIDGTQIRLIGEVNGRTKQSFLSGAIALLFPIDWPEPFGLVMIEAMACGTPVIAFGRGSVPEVIENGVSGYIVEDETEALAAIERIHHLDRHRVRAEFERRFTSRRMVGDYLRHYSAVMSNGCQPPRYSPGDRQTGGATLAANSSSADSP